jgi:glycosyltransferase involved in cell wall biosynthesis
MDPISNNTNLNKTLIFSANTSWYLFNFRRSTIKKFLSEGYKVYCLSPYDEYSIRLQDIGCIYLPLKINNKGFNPFSDIKLFIDILITYIKVKPIAVFQFTIKNNIYGTYASYILRIPSINNISGFGTAFIHNGFKYKIARILYKFSLRLSTRVFCQNKDDYYFILNNKLIHQERLDLLPGSGVDLKRFKRRNAYIQNLNDGFIFIYAGRFLYDKGLKELISSFEKIDQKIHKASLWLIGFQDSKNISSIHRSVIDEWALKPNISILEPTNEMHIVLDKADCFVLPSYREGMPRSILEACAMELPIICTNVPGCKEIVTDKLNGLLCKPKDSDSLFQAMSSMLRMTQSSRIGMGIEGRKRVEKNYSEDIVIQKTKEALKKVLDMSK